MTLIHTGSVIVDQIMRVHQVPAPGADTLALSATMTPGGGLNSLVAAAVQGMDVVLCGLVGTGPYASLIKQSLDHYGIRRAYPDIPDRDNGYCVALVDDDGERTFITHLGVEGDFAYEHLSQIHPAPGDYVYVCGYSLATPSNAEALARWLPEIDPEIEVCVDPSPLVSELDEALFEPLVRRATIWSANARETAIMAGTDDLDQAARQMAARLQPGAWVVVRDGARPTRLCQRLASGEVGAVMSVPTFPVTPVDTSGAGDVHVGTMLARLAAGDDMPTAVREANRAAAQKVTHEGPVPKVEGLDA